MLNKKYQIAQTMNWIVATITIVVILLISLFLANGKWYERKVEFKDKQKDFVATKTIVNYVDSDFENIRQYITEENYSKINDALRPILERLWYKNRGNAWNFELYIDDSLEYLIPIYLLGDEDSYSVNILFNVEDKKIRMRFWEETGWVDVP